MTKPDFLNGCSQYAPTRRGFLRGITLGAAGMTLGAGMHPHAAFAEEPKNARVSFVTGSDRSF